MYWSFAGGKRGGTDTDGVFHGWPKPPDTAVERGV